MLFSMDFQSAMETFAEAWVAASTGEQTQALALTRTKSPKKESSVPASPSHAGGRESELASPKAPSGATVNVSSASSNSSSAEPPATDRAHSTSPDGGNGPPSVNHVHGPDSSSNGAPEGGPSSAGTGAPAAVRDLGAALHPAISVSQSLLAAAAAASASRSVTPRISVSTSLTGPENGPTAGNGPSGHPGTSGRDSVSRAVAALQSNSSNGPNVDRAILQSPVNAKSLPLHCVVESVSSLQATLNFDTRNPWKRRPNIETDSYVIIPAATPFCDIVTTALQRLGYSTEISNAARGSISIKNWKSLSLDAISDNPLVSVNDILGELTSVVTLKITILRNKPSQLAEIKDKLLKLLILQSHALLRSTGCPLDEITLSQICRSPLQNTFPFTPEITDETRRNFDQWWSNQLAPQPNPIAHKILPFANPPQPSDHLDFPSHGFPGLHAAKREAGMLSVGEGGGAGGHHGAAAHHNLVVHPALQTVHSQYPNQKTRMRTSFDPEMELPKLQRWFQENPHPSRQQIQAFVVQLNSLESRRGRKPLDVNNVVYWFKNARAAQKRAEMRQSMTNGFGTPGMMLSQADYMKSSPSAPSEDIDNLSQDEMDDELHRPCSPQLPLSLTIHERNHPSLTPSDQTPIKQEHGAGPGCRTPPPPANHQLFGAENSSASGSTNNNNGSTNSNNNGAGLNSSQSNNSNNNNNSSNNSSNNNGNNNNNNESAGESALVHDEPKSNYSNERSSSPQRSSHSPASEDLDMDEPDVSNLDDYRSPSPDSKRQLPFAMNNPMLSHSIMYMSHYIPAMQGAAGMHLKGEFSPGALGQGGLNLSFNSEERRKRNRTFIDPVTEVPKLEQWFSMNTHPSHNLILKYTEDLNRMPYRQKFPRLESKNVQFWFKNRRAKCKRLKMSLYDPAQLANLGEQAHLAQLADQAHLANLADQKHLVSLGDQAHLAALHDAPHLAGLHDASQLHKFHHAERD